MSLIAQFDGMMHAGKFLRPIYTDIRNSILYDNIQITLLLTNLKN